jgi:hypothetical protein
VKKQVRKKPSQVSTPLAIAIIVIVVVILGILGKVLLRPRMPAAPPELQGRSREAPAEGMMKSGGLVKGQPRQGLAPGKAPE